MKENIVILGAGFGGLKAAMYLGKRAKKGLLPNHNITLIDKNDYHTYTPTLYEISTTSKEVANYITLESINSFPIKRLLHRLPVRFAESEVTKIDAEEGDVHLSNKGKIPYDYLILALGSETNFFGIRGIEKHALELKTFMDALKIRDKIWELVEGAEPSDKVNIVIGGAGPTGVELAGELQAWIGQLRKEGYNCKTQVSVVDAAPTILSRFDTKTIRKAAKRLKKVGVKIITRQIITRVDKNALHTKSGRKISFDVFVWAGGVKANKLTMDMPMKTKRGEKFEVESELLCLPRKSDMKLHGKIYGVGDIICTHHPKTGEEVPGVARAAISHAVVASKNIIRETQGKKPVNYRPMNYPYVIPIGGKYAIAKLGPIVISGFFGWILKGLVEINYLLSIMPADDALKTWFKGLKIFIQNDRLG